MSVLRLSVCLSAPALCLLPEPAELLPWLSPVLVLPVLQLLYCYDISEPLVEQKTWRQNRDLAHSLLLRISGETSQPKQVTMLLRCNNSIINKLTFFNEKLFQFFICKLE